MSILALSSTYIFSSQLIKHLIYKFFLFRVEILTAILEAQKQRVSRQGIDIDKLKHQHLSGKVRREIATKIVQSSTVVLILFGMSYFYLEARIIIKI